MGLSLHLFQPISKKRVANFPLLIQKKLVLFQTLDETLHERVQAVHTLFQSTFELFKSVFKLRHPIIELCFNLRHRGMKLVLEFMDVILESLSVTLELELPLLVFHRQTLGVPHRFLSFPLHLLSEEATLCTLSLILRLDMQLDHAVHVAFVESGPEVFME